MLGKLFARFKVWRSARPAPFSAGDPEQVAALLESRKNHILQVAARVARDYGVDLRALASRPRSEYRPDASDGGIVYLERDDLAEVEAHSWVGDAYYSKVPTNTNVAYRPVDPPIDPDRPFQVVVSMDDAHWAVLVELAEKRGLSFSNLMLQALRVYQAEDRCGAIAAHLRGAP